MTNEQRGAEGDAVPPSGVTDTRLAKELWLVGDGEMVSRVRDFDWAATAIGSIETWPASLRNTVATILHSRHPMFLWWGPELIQIYNDAYAPSFGVGKHPQALGERGKTCWPEIWAIIGPEIEAVMTRGTASWHDDARVPIFRNGKIEEAFWTYGYSPAFDDQGRIGGTLVVCTETTARVMASRAVLRERTRLEEFFEQVPAGVCTFQGEDLTFEFANERYQRFIGKRELVGKSLLTAIPELQGQGFDDLLRTVLRTGETMFRHEVPARYDRDGDGNDEEMFYTFSYSPFRDSEGAIGGVIAIVLDVTEQVHARRDAEILAEKLRESEGHFHQLAESIPQLAWMARADGNIEWYNRRWHDFTGSAFEPMAGWGWGSEQDPSMLDDVVRESSRAIAAGEPFEMQFPLRRYDGTFRWHLTRAMPLRDAAGTVVRWFGTNTDIDDSRRAEQERIELLKSERAARLSAESANLAKDEFLATASHELRTPLSAILGWTRMLRDSQIEPSGLPNALARIQHNAESQVRLIEDILDGSRVVTGKLRLEIRPLDMAAVVRAALDGVKAAADAKEIRLTVTINPDATVVFGDAERLQQVVWNLASNAIKFTPKGGHVHVDLQRVESDVELAVTDTGLGIEAEFLPFVFERFRQAENKTSRRHGGLGLGLALVRGLVEAHGGTVRVASGGKGLGARFAATIPARAEQPEGPPNDLPKSIPAPTEAAPAPVSLVGVDVLVVDDDDDARYLVAASLRAKGATVTAAEDANAVLELLEQNSYDVMVSDVGMPIVDGYELVRQIRSLSGPAATIPAIALTAYARDEDRRLALASGFQGYLSKPVDAGELARVIKAVTAR